MRKSNFAFWFGDNPWPHVLWTSQCSAIGLRSRKNNPVFMRGCRFLVTILKTSKTRLLLICSWHIQRQKTQQGPCIQMAQNGLMVSILQQKWSNFPGFRKLQSLFRKNKPFAHDLFPLCASSLWPLAGQVQLFRPSPAGKMLWGTHQALAIVENQWTWVNSSIVSIVSLLSSCILVSLVHYIQQAYDPHSCWFPLELFSWGGTWSTRHDTVTGHHSSCAVQNICVTSFGLLSAKKNTAKRIKIMFQCFSFWHNTFKFGEKRNTSHNQYWILFLPENRTVESIECILNLLNVL